MARKYPVGTKLIVTAAGAYAPLHTEARVGDECIIVLREGSDDMFNVVGPWGNSYGWYWHRIGEYFEVKRKPTIII